MGEILFDKGPIEASDILRVEGIFGVSLPESYKELVLHHDAPVFRENIFFFENPYWSEDWSYVLADGKDSRDLNFLSVKPSFDNDFEKIHYHSDFFEEYERNVVPFGITASGDYICFDYREDPPGSCPSVVLVFHDMYDGNNRNLICRVANSFDQLLGSLVG